MNTETNQPRPPKSSKPPPQQARPQPEPRPSAQEVFDNLDKWANSPGLQPPK